MTDEKPRTSLIDAIRTNLSYSPQRRDIDSTRTQTGVGAANLGRRLQEVATTQASLPRAIAAMEDFETLDLLKRELDG